MILPCFLVHLSFVFSTCSGDDLLMHPLSLNIACTSANNAQYIDSDTGSVGVKSSLNHINWILYRLWITLKNGMDDVCTLEHKYDWLGTFSSFPLYLINTWHKNYKGGVELFWRPTFQELVMQKQETIHEGIQ